MPDPTLGPVTKRYADHSTPEGFAFSFFCDKCGEEKQSAWYAFNPGGFLPPIDPQVFQMLWNDQHKAAYERANHEAFFAFNRCPECERRVCTDCFYLSEMDVSDICKDCLAGMQKGSRGAPGALRGIWGGAAFPARTETDPKTKKGGL